MTPGRHRGHPPLQLSTSTLVVAALVVSAIYGTGFLRTRAAAARLIQAEGRRRPTEDERREAQPVLDVARFATDAGSGPVPAPPHIGAAPPPTIGAASAPAGLPAASAGVNTPRTTVAPPSPAVAAAASPTSPEPETVFIPGAPAASPPATAGEGTSPAVPVPAVTPPPPTPREPPTYRDGTFTGWGYCRHGEIQARVVIEHGRIVDAAITQCLTRYSCDWIEKLPGQVVSRQSEEVDYVAGASESADAFYFAIVEALKQAK